MTISVEQLQLLFPENIWLKFPAFDSVVNISKTTKFTNKTAENNAQINDLCLTVFLDLIGNELGLEAEELSSLKKKDIASIWDVLNGTAITLGKTKIILIPSEVIDTEEFSVPQEWVDIPNLLGNYYLPLQVDWDNRLVGIWGYTSHQTLKNQGRYDPIYRTYSLARNQMILDLETLWLATELGLKEIENIKPIANLPGHTIEKLLEQLSQPSPYSPRLELGFEQWSALFGDRYLRQQLYQRRLSYSLVNNSLVTSAQVENNFSQASKRVTVQKQLTNLTTWLNHQFTESIELGWQSIDNFLFDRQTSLAYRNNTSWRKQNNNAIQRAKLIRLQMQVETVEVILLVGVTPEAKDQVKVLIQLHPNSDRNTLPPGLTMSLFSEDSIIGKPIVSQEDDLYLQTLPLHCSSNTNFQVQITLEATSIVENFIIT